MLTWLVEHASEDAAAVVRPSGETMTFGDLTLAVRATAETLVQSGVSLAGRGIGVAVTDQAGALVSILAAFEVGAIPILLPTSATDMLAICRPALLLRGQVDDRIELEPGDADPRLFGPEVGMVLPSSGSAGLAHAVVLPGRGMQLQADLIGAQLGLDASTRTAVLSPFHHVTPLIGQALSTLRRGGAVLALSWGQAVDTLPALLHRLGADSVTAPPSLLGRLARATLALASEDRPQLRFVASVGAPREAWIDRELGKAFPAARRWDHYGLTEAGGRVAATHDAARGSVGIALPGMTVVAVNDGGDVLPPGQSGELRVSSPSLMLEYLDAPEATRKILGSGGLLTGDLGRVDADGRVFVDGRRDDQAKIGLHRVFTESIAAALRQEPGVGELCVLGALDPEGGQRLVCFVEANPTVVDRLRERARGLLPPERPSRYVELDHLPHLDNHKIDRQSLRRMVEL